MILQASYNEINDIIRQKSGQDVQIAYKGADSLNVSFTASVKVPILGQVAKTFSAVLHLLSIDGTRITAEIDTGSLGATILNHLKSVLLAKVPDGLVENFDGKRIVLNLSAIPQTKAVFDNLDVNKLTISENAVYVDASMKA